MSKIEWTDKTLNPITGCTKVSPGCLNCYAEKMSARLATMPAMQNMYAGITKDGKWTGQTHYDSEVMKKVHCWHKPRRIFLCSMSDMFHQTVGHLELDNIFYEINQAPRHMFFVLTKRALAMHKWVNNHQFMFKSFNNVMFGVSVEDNETAIYRLPQLLTMYEPNRFISVEPLLGKIDLTPYLHGIKWVICGCESGSNRRHADINWIRDLRDQCVEANVPFFLKQMEINGKVVKMPELDGKVWDQTPLRYSPSGWWVDPVNVYEEAKP